MFWLLTLSFFLSFHFRWFAIREFHLFGGSFASTGCDVLRREKKEKKIRDIYTTHCTHCTDRSISEYQAKISTAKRRQCLSGQPPPDRLLFRCCQGQAEIPDTQPRRPPLRGFDTHTPITTQQKQRVHVPPVCNLRPSTPTT